jgi:hypothetical protein
MVILIADGPFRLFVNGLDHGTLTPGAVHPISLWRGIAAGHQPVARRSPLAIMGCAYVSGTKLFGGLEAHQHKRYCLNC